MLGSLLQHLSTLTVKIFFFLLSRLNPPVQLGASIGPGEESTEGAQSRLTSSPDHPSTPSLSSQDTSSSFYQLCSK